MKFRTKQQFGEASSAGIVTDIAPLKFQETKIFQVNFSGEQFAKFNPRQAVARGAPRVDLGDPDHQWSTP